MKSKFDLGFSLCRRGKLYTRAVQKLQQDLDISTLVLSVNRLQALVDCGLEEKHKLCLEFHQSDLVERRLRDKPLGPVEGV